MTPDIRTFTSETATLVDNRSSVFGSGRGQSIGDVRLNSIANEDRLIYMYNCNSRRYG